MSDIRKAHEEEQEEARRQTELDKQGSQVFDIYQRAMQRAEADYQAAQRRINRDTRIALALLLLIVLGYVVAVVVTAWRAA